MPVDNFPKALEAMLVNLLEDYELTSWNIKGGNLFTQVSIRFGAEAMCDNTVEHVSYKKMSKARNQRDR